VTEREAPRPAVSVGDILSAGSAPASSPGSADPSAGEDLRLIAGAGGLRRAITSAVAGKPGLALAGEHEALTPGSVQVLGRSEMAFMAQAAPTARRDLIDRLVRSPVACLVLSHGASLPADLGQAAEALDLPVLSTRLASDAVIERLGRRLEERLAPSIVVHGTLIDIYGVGVLMLGESGIGKSESALELILRGHRLVSDDVVSIRRFGALLNGTGPEVSRFHMELRGIGIINIKDLYGVAAVRERKDLDLVVQLDPWQAGKDYERLGLDDATYPLLGVPLPFIELPVRPGRNVSILLEVAARHLLLRSRGYHPARELAERIQQALGQAG
jgi:HPr kinase/phosphorylase